MFIFVYKDITYQIIVGHSKRSAVFWKQRFKLVCFPKSQSYNTNNFSENKDLPPPRTCSNSCPSSWRCHLTIPSSVIQFSSCLQSFPTSGSFPMSQFFISGGQSIGASASFLSMNIQELFPLGLTGLTSLGLS